MEQLGNTLPRLLCSLVHKFGKKDVDNFDEFIKELKRPDKDGGRTLCFCG